MNGSKYASRKFILALIAEIGTLVKWLFFDGGVICGWILVAIISVYSGINVWKYLGNKKIKGL